MAITWRPPEEELEHWLAAAAFVHNRRQNDIISEAIRTWLETNASTPQVQQVRAARATQAQAVRTDG